MSAVLARSLCSACGEPVSYTDEGGCVGTLPNAYHMRAECLLEAYRRAGMEAERLRAALECAAIACMTGWLPDGDGIGQNQPTVMFGEELRRSITGVT